MSRLIIRNIGTLFTMEPGSEPLRHAELVIEDGVVAGVTGSAAHGSGSDAFRGNPYPPRPEIVQEAPGSLTVDAHGALVTPGLVDPHTHLVYGANRAHEMGLKLAGVPYLEILAEGGGILSTVNATRRATDDDLLATATVRLDAMLAMGTTTVEVKSGYGLSLEHELRLLGIIRELQRRHSMTIVPTFLGAHAIPPEYRPDPDRYVDILAEAMIPSVAGQGLAQFCDVFCETGVFSVAQSRRILEAARNHDLLRKIHADEIDPPSEGESGARLAAEMGCTSADHLRATDESGFLALAEGNVVPVVLPATSFCLRDHHYANARGMIDGFGLPVALATDCNPGTSPTESLQLVMAIAALELRMTPAEILAGVTVNSARASGLANSHGTLQSGMAGDAVIWQAYDLDLLPYRFGANQAGMVIKGGTVVGRI